MAKPILRAEQPSVQEQSPAVELVNALDLTESLTEQFIQDESGRAFEPAQLDPSKELAQVVGHILRPEPLGGYEPLLAENRRQWQERALIKLNRTLASANGSSRPFIADLLVEVRARAGRLEQRAQRHERDYARTQELLHRWQNQIGQRSGGMGSDVLRWLFGDGQRLSLPEAIVLWNKREHQALQRAACAAALDAHAWVVETATDLLTRLDDLLAEARRLRGEASRRVEDRRQTVTSGMAWTWRVEPRVVADALIGRVDLEPLVAELLRRQAEDGGTEALERQVREVVAGETERLLAGLGLADFVELEAAAASQNTDDDPLILVGRALLESVQRPTWQLARSARPRVETLQVTPDGTPIYSLDGIGSASYGDGGDRLGFVQVQLGVAKDELTLLRDGDEAFQAALQQRNLFVIEELAQAWEDTHRISSAQPGASVDQPTVEMSMSKEAGQ